MVDISVILYHLGQEKLFKLCLNNYRYYEILRRRCYVTPTSYLELIKTFKSLLNQKRMQLLTLRNRYLVGLEKLEFASAQVTVMQQELTELQPELIQTSKETESLITKIAAETEEVAAKKKVGNTYWEYANSYLLQNIYRNTINFMMVSAKVFLHTSSKDCIIKFATGLYH